MIRMTKGVYGMQTGARVVPVSPEDGPFSLEPEQEKRLVEILEVAEYVDGTAPEKETCPDAEYTDKQPESIYEMTKNQLMEVARNMDIKTNARETKEELIHRIEQAQEADQYGDSDEMIPEFNPEGAVQ